MPARRRARRALARRRAPGRARRARPNQSLPASVPVTSPTAEFASLVYGPGGVAPDDPAEAFHEASRLFPDVAPARLGAIVELARNPELRQTVARASRTFEQLPGIDLPNVQLGRARLRDVLAERRSFLASGR